MTIANAISWRLAVLLKSEMGTLLEFDLIQDEGLLLKTLILEMMSDLVYRANFILSQRGRDCNDSWPHPGRGTLVQPTISLLVNILGEIWVVLISKRTQVWCWTQVWSWPQLKRAITHTSTTSMQEWHHSTCGLALCRLLDNHNMFVFWIWVKTYTGIQVVLFMSIWQFECYSIKNLLHVHM